MEDDQSEIALEVVAFEGTRLTCGRIPEIRMYEVMESELETLDRHQSAETEAMGFMTFLSGIAITLVTTLLATPAMPWPVRFCFGLLAANASLIAAVYARKWRVARKDRAELVQQIKRRSVMSYQRFAS